MCVIVCTTQLKCSDHQVIHIPYSCTGEVYLETAWIRTSTVIYLNRRGGSYDTIQTIWSAISIFRPRYDFITGRTQPSQPQKERRSHPCIGLTGHRIQCTTIFSGHVQENSHTVALSNTFCKDTFTARHGCSYGPFESCSKDQNNVRQTCICWAFASATFLVHRAPTACILGGFWVLLLYYYTVSKFCQTAMWRYKLRIHVGFL